MIYGDFQSHPHWAFAGFRVLGLGLGLRGLGLRVWKSRVSGFRGLGLGRGCGSLVLRRNLGKSLNLRVPSSEIMTVSSSLCKLCVKPVSRKRTGAADASACITGLGTWIGSILLSHETYEP